MHFRVASFILEFFMLTRLFCQTTCSRFSRWFESVRPISAVKWWIWYIAEFILIGETRPRICLARVDWLRPSCNLYNKLSIIKLFHLSSRKCQTVISENDDSRKVSLPHMFIFKNIKWGSWMFCRSLVFLPSCFRGGMSILFFFICVWSMKALCIEAVCAKTQQMSLFSIIVVPVWYSISNDF